LDQLRANLKKSKKLFSSSNSMTQQHHYIFCLRQLTHLAAGSRQPEYPLSTNQSIVIGGDPNCQIVINSTNYPGVSSRYLEIRPVMPQSPGNSPSWQVCDLA
jgi:hypothetical protein